VRHGNIGTPVREINSPPPTLRGHLPAEPPIASAVLFAMRRFGDRNDWWDWGVILLVVAGGTILLWASVWLAHSSMVTGRSAAAPAVVQPLGT